MAILIELRPARRKQAEVQEEWHRQYRDGLEWLIAEYCDPDLNVSRFLPRCPHGEYLGATCTVCTNLYLDGSPGTRLTTLPGIGRLYLRKGPNQCKKFPRDGGYQIDRFMWQRDEHLRARKDDYEGFDGGYFAKGGVACRISHASKPGVNPWATVAPAPFIECSEPLPVIRCEFSEYSDPALLDFSDNRSIVAFGERAYRRAGSGWTDRPPATDGTKRKRDRVWDIGTSTPCTDEVEKVFQSQRRIELIRPPVTVFDHHRIGTRNGQWPDKWRSERKMLDLGADLDMYVHGSQREVLDIPKMQATATKRRWHARAEMVRVHAQRNTVWPGYEPRQALQHEVNEPAGAGTRGGFTGSEFVWTGVAYKEPSNIITEEMRNRLVSGGLFHRMWAIEKRRAQIEASDPGAYDQWLRDRITQGRSELLHNLLHNLLPRLPNDGPQTRVAFIFAVIILG